MRNFQHIDASSLKEVASLLKKSGGKARAIAGGTDLLGEMKDEILPEYPETVVNLKSIPGLDYIRERNGSLHIGALTRLEDIAKNKVVRDKYPLLAEATRRTASPHIREMGTIAGNICQSNRCWYYWTPDNRFNCLRKGGRECYAVVGDGRYHSIYGAVRVNGTPCSNACPAGVAIPDYLDKIREDNLAEAATILLQNNPLPAVTGRICPHFCESECNRGSYDEAVSIRCIERTVGDYSLQNPGEFYRPPKKPMRKQVAVIGSGPAGLAAACFLRRLSYGVTIFESMPQAGGLLRYGIPPFRLPKEVIKKQIEALISMGIHFKLGVRIGQDVKLAEISQQYDAVLLAVGAQNSLKLNVPGEDAKGVISALPFLKDVNAGKKVTVGKKIVVVGGGSVAMDAATTALRLGASSVQVVCLEKDYDEMPALNEEIEQAAEEGIKVDPSWGIKEVLTRAGKVIGVELKRCTSCYDKGGKFNPCYDAKKTRKIESDMVITAIGQATDLSFLPAASKIKVTRRGTFAVDEDSLATSVAGIFAAGDVRRGPATIVEAIADALKAAIAIDCYLGGTGFPSEKHDARNGDTPLKFDGDCLKKSARVTPAKITPATGTRRLNTEDTVSPDMAAAKTESRRCFNCGCLAVNASDTAPALIALDAMIKTTTRVIPAGEFFSVNGDKTTVLADDEIVAEIIIPEPETDTRFGFSKFAIRKSIDFSVVNCAAAITLHDGRVKAARICLNAVYNLPYRAAGTDEYLVGKTIDATVAEEAAAIAVRDTLPLVNNHYKIQVARTLVKRAILACGGSS